MSESPLPTYHVIRSDRKTLALEITRDAEVLVRAPRRTALVAIERFVDSHRDWIETHLARRREQIVSRAEHRLTQADEALLQKAAAAILPEKLAYYASVMGVTPTHLSITAAARRFGSCSATDRICFSWRVMLYEEAAVDYVVVHELAHILHHDHSPAFHACVALILPDHKARRALLKKPPTAIPAWVTARMEAFHAQKNQVQEE